MKLKPCFPYFHYDQFKEKETPVIKEHRQVVY